MTDAREAAARTAAAHFIIGALVRQNNPLPQITLRDLLLNSASTRPFIAYARSAR